MGRVKSINNPTPTLKHFSHPHEMELITQLQDLSLCSGCRLPPLGEMYICRPCNFTLHLSCTKFPQLITHPSHPNHPLNLLPTSKYPGGQFNCDACKRHGTGFSYHCSFCEFDLHVICASKPLKITHQLHQCLLELTFKNPYANAKGFSCDVCHKIGAKQWLYRCPSCEFDVHLDCLTSAPRQTVQAQASQSTALQHHHSFPGSTSQFQQPTMGIQARPNQLMHAASTGAIPNNHTLQPPVFQGQGQVRPNQLFHSASTSAVPEQQFQGQVRPNQLIHSASTSAVPQQQFVQPPIQGQVRPNQYMQPQGANSGFGNALMNAAIQGLVEGAAEQVGQTLMQGIIGGGDNTGGNGGSSILGSIFGDSSDPQY